MQDVYEQMASKIIEEQEQIIGPVAVEQANQVHGLVFNSDEHSVKIDGDRLKIIDELISKYKDFFGQAAVEVCKDASRPFLSQLPANDIPSFLR